MRKLSVIEHAKRDREISSARQLLDRAVERRRIFLRTLAIADYTFIAWLILISMAFGMGWL